MAGLRDSIPSLPRTQARAGVSKEITNFTAGPALSSRVTGIVLVAGLSSRMGCPKALLPLGGRPALVGILSEILASDLDQVILVLGAQGKIIRQTLGAMKQNSKLTLTYNPAYRKGLSASIKKGLTRVSPEVSGVMFLMGDQPLLRTTVINRLIRKFLEQPDSSLVPQYGRRPGNPVIFPATFIPELEKLTGDTGGREIIRRHQERVRFQLIRPSRLGWDMDTWEDYEKIKEWIHEKSQG